MKTVLTNQLLKEHSRKNTDQIVSYVEHNEKAFDELIAIYLDGSYRITQRAAWPIGILSIKYPTLVQPHLRNLLDCLKKESIPNAVKRNTVRLLQYIDIPKKLQGIVVNICLQYLSDNKETIAVRTFSMSVLANLARENSELKNEIIPLIEEHLPYGSQAFKNRAIKVLAQLKRQPSI